MVLSFYLRTGLQSAIIREIYFYSTRIMEWNLCPISPKTVEVAALCYLKPVADGVVRMDDSGYTRKR